VRFLLTEPVCDTFHAIQGQTQQAKGRKDIMKYVYIALFLAIGQSANAGENVNANETETVFASANANANATSFASQRSPTSSYPISFQPAQLEKYDMVLEYCSRVDTNRRYGDGGAVVFPVSALEHFFGDKAPKGGLEPEKTKLRILQGPSHGDLVPYLDQKFEFLYNSKDAAFTGMDKAIFSLEYGRKHFKMIYKLHVAADHDTPDESEQMEYDRVCPRKVRRISTPH
jgi:hypothetical protein